MTSQATRLLDAQTVLVGWINHSATDCYEHTRSSGDVVNLGTDLDATSSFVLVASHPGHSGAVTVTLELAPLLADGNAGSWITAAAVAIPAAGGKVEAIISGAALPAAGAGDGFAWHACRDDRGAYRQPGAVR